MIICDRCSFGREDASMFLVDFHHVQRNGSAFGKDGDYHICGTCKRELEKWIKTRKDNEDDKPT